MTHAVTRRQGQPVLFLGLLLAGWCLLRVLTWESPWPQALGLPEPLHFASADLRQPDTTIELNDGIIALLASNDRLANKAAGRSATVPVFRSPMASIAERPPFERPDPIEHFDTHRRAAGHNLLFAAGMARLPLPRSVAAVLDREQNILQPVTRAIPRRASSPWRMDGWVVMRGDGLQPSESGSRPASYGASQLGAVLSYRLAPSTPHVPAAYIRASRALVDGGETEGALGLRARPFAGIPLTIHAEGRLTARPGHSPEIRPAAFVAGGFDRLDLPAQVVARGYGQAGYVGGEFATPFADGAFVAEREVARFDLGRVALGGGIWGGVQQGAARLDIGPSLTVDLRLGDAPARIEADYRWRVAGNAEPGNGGVVTLSTGF
ncbi:hypothetical protein N6L26_00840 [Qipengyuania sp. SS22]|uniref:hypothetical protein n=1 Tax=Qipengyuania sp. SS22 TaxID=2979461 RepID=UPI0021E61C25|nr:hypothetical protein [Qipengyuania sp. SS22]UYH55148.1 hypothetical protein N6L26_00840 [Qipengyuania sp. SS22]